MGDGILLRKTHGGVFARNIIHQMGEQIILLPYLIIVGSFIPVKSPHVGLTMRFALFILSDKISHRLSSKGCKETHRIYMKSLSVWKEVGHEALEGALVWPSEYSITVHKGWFFKFTKAGTKSRIISIFEEHCQTNLNASTALSRPYIFRQACHLRLNSP